MERSRAKRRIVTFGVLTVLLVFAGKNCYDTDILAAARSYDGQVAGAKSEGLLTSLEDYKPAVVPDGQNAAPAYQSAIADVTGRYSKPFKKIAEYKPGAHPTAAQQADLDRAIEATDPVLEKVREAAELPSVDFKRPWQQGFQVHFTEYGPLALLSNVLQEDGKLAMRRGDVDRAVLDAQTIAGMSRHMGQEPVILAAIVRAGMVDDAFGVLAEALRTHGREPKIRGTIRKAVTDMGDPPDVKEVAKLEMPVQLDVVDSLVKGPRFLKEFSGDDFPAAWLGKFEFGRKAFKARTIEYWREIYSKLPADKADYLDAYKVIYDIGEEFEHKNLLSYSIVNYYRLNYMLGTVAMARAETKKRLLLSAVDLLDGKTTLLVDPFSNKPLNLKGRTLYSVGENKQDDGGSTTCEAHSTIPKDFVLTLPNG